MIILLDTNALVWLLDDSKNLGGKAKEALDDADMVYVSSVNILELTIKSMLGKIGIPNSLEEDIESSGLKMMAFTSAHANALTQFPALTRHDPFDRMLLATAKVESINLMTSDKVLLDLDLNYTINARL